MTRKGRTTRVALLSEDERRLLERAEKRKELQKERDSILSKDMLNSADNERIRQINKELATISRRLATLINKLDTRLSALGIDMLLILKSQSLKPLISIRSQYVDDITPAWQEIHRPVAGFDYSTWRVKQVPQQSTPVDNPPPSKVAKRRSSRYWLDTNVAAELTVADIFKPQYSLRGIKSKVWIKGGYGKYPRGRSGKRFDVRVILGEAVELEKRYQEQIDKHSELEILPKSEAEAIDIYRIESAIKQLREAVPDLLRENDGQNLK